MITHRTERNLIIGGFIIMFVVGRGLIALLWGIEGMLQSWLCIGGGTLLLFAFVIIVGMRLTVRLVIDDALADQTFVRK